MINDMMLPFPVLQADRADFAESISYKVKASPSYHQSSLDITHTLTGIFFISGLLQKKQAIFSVALFYKDHAERQMYKCSEDSIKYGADKITAKQNITVSFSYLPEIMVSIILLKESIIKVDDEAGLTDLWQSNQSLSIPAYSRIAYYLPLDFTSDKLSTLIWKELNKGYSDGTVKTVVRETVGSSKVPITIICAQDVFYALDNQVTALLPQK